MASELPSPRVCSREGCSAMDDPAAGVVLAACTRCRSVAYCGRDCQAQDWRARHKSLCAAAAAAATAAAAAAVPPLVEAPLAGDELSLSTSALQRLRAIADRARREAAAAAAGGGEVVGDSESALTALEEVAEELERCGRHVDAERTYRELYERRCKFDKKEVGGGGGKGGGSLPSLAALSALAHVVALLRARRHYTEALPLSKIVYEGRRRHLGVGSPPAVVSSYMHAQLLEDCRKMRDAERLFRETLSHAKSSAALGEEHPTTLLVLGFLGQHLLDQSRLVEAEPLLQDVLLKRRRVLGHEHPDTLTAVHNVAYFLQLRGGEARHVESEALFRECLEARRRIEGHLHPSTLHACNTLGGLLVEMGRYDEAEPLLREALKGRCEALGEDHPHTRTTAVALDKLLKTIARRDRRGAGASASA